MSKIRVIIGGSEGRMGRIIQEMISKSSDIEVAFGFDPKKADLKSFADILKLKGSSEKTVDVYVDFTSPGAVIPNVEQASKVGIDSLIGTTGWYDRLDDVKNIAFKSGRRILYAPNFSPGVNVMFYLTHEAARLLGKFEYDVAVHEVHHAAKVDAPSGTAVTLGNILLKETKREKLAYERREKRKDTEVDVLGIRVGRVAGYHEVWFTPKDTYAERLILQHDAFTPEVFAIGALVGIRWIAEARQKKKPAGLYTFYEDVLGLGKL